MKKVIKINPKTTKSFIQFFNGMFNLTEKEIQVLSQFVDKYNSLKEHNIDVFSAPVKKQIAEELGMEDFNVLNNYIKAFKDKNAIRKKDNKYQINPLFIRTIDEEGIYFEYVRR